MSVFQHSFTVEFRAPNREEANFLLAMVRVGLYDALVDTELKGLEFYSQGSPCSGAVSVFALTDKRLIADDVRAALENRVLDYIETKEAGGARASDYDITCGELVAHYLPEPDLVDSLSLVADSAELRQLMEAFVELRHAATAVADTEAFAALEDEGGEAAGRLRDALKNLAHILPGPKAGMSL